MNLLLVLGMILLYAHGDSLPVIRMQMGPEQLADSLRDGKPQISESDCQALNLWECHAQDAVPVQDVSLRFVQLDDDPELEAILVVEAKAEWTYMAYIFDRRATVWNMVGAFSCNRRPCDVNSLVRTEKLTTDSPPLVLYYRDVGGSDGTIMLTTGYLLRKGRLWEVRDFVNCSDSLLPVHTTERQLVSADDHHLVIHTINQAEGKPEHHKCEVLRWDQRYLQFYEPSNEPIQLCDFKAGKPIPGKSHPTKLSVCALQ